MFTKVVTLMTMPDEVLLEILQYLSALQIVCSLRYVNTRCRRFSFLPELWSRVTFRPPVDMSDLVLASYLTDMPQLKHLNLNHTRDLGFLLSVVRKQCEALRSLVVTQKNGPDVQQVLLLLNRYPGIQRLEVNAVNTPFHVDYARMCGPFHRKFSLQLERSDDLTRAQRVCFLTANCSLDIDLLALICQRRELKCLLIYNAPSASDKLLDLTPLDALRNLESLQVRHLCDCLPSKHGPYYPLLTRLELVQSGGALCGLLNSLLRRCPSLTHLNVQDNLLCDNDLCDVVFCNFLQYLDVSRNFQLSDEFLAIVSVGCRHIRFLDVTYCRGVTDYVILLLQTCANLETLRIEGADLTGRFFYLIPLLYRRLIELHVRHFCNVELLQMLRSEMPQLTIVRCPIPPSECDN